MAAAHAAAAASRHRVNLINKYNTGMVPLGIREQITDTGSAHTHEHFHKIRTGDTEERHAGLSCHRLRKQSLTGSGRSLQQHALGNPCSHADIFLGQLKEIHDLPQLLLFFLKACHIFKSGMDLLLGGHSGPASAEIHHLSAPAAILAVQEHHHKHNRYHCCQERNPHSAKQILLPYLPEGHGYLIILKQIPRLDCIRHVDLPL